MCPTRCRANMAHMRQSRPYSGLGFQVKLLKPFQVVPVLLRGGPPAIHETPSQNPSSRSGYRATSLIRNRTPPRTAIRPYAYAYCRVLGGCGFL